MILTKFKYLLLLTVMLTGLLPAGAIESEESKRESQAEYNLREANDAFNVSDYNTALAHYLIFIRFAEADKSGKYDKQLMCAYNPTGNIYIFFKNFPIALTNFQKGLNLSRKFGDKKWQSIFLMNELSCYTETGQLDKAYKCNEQVIKLVKDPTTMFSYVFNKGYINELRGNWKDARKYLEQSMDTINKYKLEDLKAYPYSELYKVYAHDDDYANALRCLGLFERFAKPAKRRSAFLLEECYRGYISVYRKMGDNRNVLIYQDKYIRLQDSLMNVNKFLETSGKYQADNEHDNAITITGLNTTVSKQRIVLVLGAIILILLAVIIYMVYRYSKKLYESNRALYQRNQELMTIDKQRKDEAAAKTNSSDTESIVPTDNDKELIVRIRNVMESGNVYCDTDFSLQTLARLVDSNTNYVSHAINTLGQNFRSFINEYRIREARLRLADDENYGQQTIQAIAESVGFKSASSFGIAFKKFTGMTPAAFQKMAKEEKSAKMSSNS